MGAITISFAGEQTIRTVSEAAERLRAALAAGTAVEICCAGITDVDLSFLQVVLATRKSAERDGRAVMLAASAQGALLACLQAGGLLPEELEGQVSSDTSFWMKRGDV